MLWVDEPQWMRGGQKTGHLFGDDLGELHRVANECGLPAKSFNGEAPVPHYVVRADMVQALIERGATAVTGKARERALTAAAEAAWAVRRALRRSALTRDDTGTAAHRPERPTAAAKAPPGATNAQGGLF